MRNQWRLLSLRSLPRSQPHISRNASNFQVRSAVNNSRFFSSFLHSRSSLSNSQIQNPRTLNLRYFSSSELDSDHAAVLSNIFSKPDITNDGIKLELDSNNIVISHDMVLKFLRNPNASPDVARKLFDWVSESQPERLSSKSYNFMLGVLGANGYVKEFWDLVEVMKKKGYGVKRGTNVRVSEKFEKEGLSSDLEKLVELYANGSVDCSIEKLSSRALKVINQGVWEEKTEEQLLKIPFSSEVVANVLENLGAEPNKALIFFRWVQEKVSQPDATTYNALARVLSREDSVEKFWKVVEEMRVAGYEMETETYFKVSGRFVERNMIKDAVELYEFAMSGANKPSVQDFTYLLKKIVVGKELDVDLFLKVVKVFKSGGNLLTNSTLDAVLKSLTSVGRLGECNKILKAMEEGGFLPNDALQGKIAYGLGSNGEKDEVNKFINGLEGLGCTPNYRTWASFVEGYCVAGDLDQASKCFQTMVSKTGASSAGYALALLVDAYCRKKNARDAYKLLFDMVNEKEVKAYHPTYKVLIRKLLVQRGFKEALTLLPLMKSQGFPPFMDPFIEHISKKGTTDDALMFLTTMTSKKNPNTAVFLRVFESYFKAGKHNAAQDLLSKCPGDIRSHADVLHLFFSRKSVKAAAAATPVTA